MDEQSKKRHEELVELAKLCLFESKVTKARDVAAEFRRMAKDYQKRAAEIDSGRLPDIGEDGAAVRSSGRQNKKRTPKLAITQQTCLSDY